MGKILIIRFSSIGDVVLTSPILRCLRKKFPDADIHYCTKKQYVQLISENPNVTKIHCLDGSLKDLTKELKSENFDLVIDLHNNIRTFRIKLALGIKQYTFRKLNFRKWILTRLNINTLPQIHIVSRYFNAIKKLDVYYDGLGLDFFIPESQNKFPEEFPFTKGEYIVYAIGAQHNTKKLPLRKAIEMLENVNSPLVLIGGKEDELMGLKLKEAIAGKNIYNGCGRLNIMQSAVLCNESKAVITHDTGMMHISAALNKPIVSVWGNTIPGFGMFPFYKDGEEKNNLRMFEVNGLGCRPCSKIGYDTCPKGHFDCMMKQDFTTINSLFQ